ncbi:MAG: carboxylating nicotinate-nucleotide diphosphorylase [Clostridiaceae bacterium]|jgi:nicotinate-nucleotide pyrophosphorylase (carboxylating)|nr:carboxylating nicotinate-nucleotide diphosphorylase [Clostridiaceae bacterium]
MLDNIIIDRIIKNALEEDLGWGDVTTDSTIPDTAVIKGNFIAKEEGIICGIEICRRVFEIVDDSIDFQTHMKDGQRAAKGDIIAEISGNARSILKGERTALNFFQRMSGIATMTSEYVSKISGLKTKIADTRKTVPGLRILDKYSVKVGGGFNHRFNLSDMVLIKDNHIKAAGGIAPAVAAAKAKVSHAVKIEVEVESIKELMEAMEAGADIIMLDNMTLDMMKEAVGIAGGKVLLEASGNITIEGERSVRAVAETGVDIISAGALTNSVEALDISLRFL